jgi:CheY-like chemotaxis protein
MDLEQTFQEATDAFHVDAKRKGIEYKVTMHPGLPKRVLGDQRTIRQSMTNLIANAITNTVEGGVTVETYVSMIDNGIAYVEVAVQDSGVGMSAKKMDALLVSLEQVQPDQYLSTVQELITASEASSDNTDDNTIGLGLAIVARIVRNMKGQLRLRSAEGQGSRFVIQYPLEVVETEDGGTVSPTREEQRLLGSKPAESEVLLVERNKSRLGSTRTSRRPSNESQRSQVDRLVEAMQDSIRPIKTADPSGALVPSSRSGNASGVRGKEAVLSAENLHILVAEDDPINSKILKKRLERSGHTVHLTGNGAECASAYSETEWLFDVVLMDIQVSQLSSRR